MCRYRPIRRGLVPNLDGGSQDRDSRVALAGYGICELLQGLTLSVSGLNIRVGNVT